MEFFFSKQAGSSIATKIIVTLSISITLFINNTTLILTKTKCADQQNDKMKKQSKIK